MDYRDDKNFVALHRLIYTGANLPSWVKQASIPNENDFKELPATCFADPVKKAWPIHTKEAAFFSAIALSDDKYADLPEPVVSKIAEACRVHQIENLVTSSLSSVSQFQQQNKVQTDNQTKAASPQHYEFAVDTIVNDSPLRMFPMNNADEVVSSACELSEIASEGRLDSSFFHKTASTLCKKARSLGALHQLPEVILDAGLDRLFDKTAAAQLIEDRSGYVSEENMELYREAVKRAGDDAALLLDCIKDLDNAFNVKYAYERLPGVGALSPERVVFSGAPVELVESQTNGVFRLNDNVMVPVEELAKKASNIKFGLPSDKADALVKAAEDSHGLEVTRLIGQLTFKERDYLEKALLCD